jgi:hypothetical protein
MMLLHIIDSRGAVSLSSPKGYCHIPGQRLIVKINPLDIAPDDDDRLDRLDRRTVRPEARAGVCPERTRDIDVRGLFAASLD